ncbi:MAG TPA: catalase family protein [Chitinophagaceae bacterium]|nr:catalase family protein [Chitinophagaceae bacterium]
MSTRAVSNGKLLLGHEYPPESEQEIIDEMVHELEAQLERLYVNTKTLRQIHPKMHGAVKAEFIVESDLPEELRVGVFRTQRSFPCWVRFSNGNTRVHPDRKRDIRGVAIKLMGVQGEKILESPIERQTQDFIFLSSPAFLARDLAQFRPELKAATSPYLINLILYLLNPVHFGVTARTIKSLIPCTHPFSIPYFSTIPFRFGDKDRAVKYHLRPSPSNQLEYTDPKKDDFLRANMVATLAKRDINYDFCIQFQLDPVKMPIENPTLVWTSPFIKVATLRIPAQLFDTPEQREFGDNLSFNSWHCLYEHFPLGGFNRARRQIYIALYKFRHERNHIPVTEPVADAHFYSGIKINSNG